MLSQGHAPGVLAMVILGRMLAWLGYIAATALLMMAGIYLFQGITGQYERDDAYGDPFGLAIVCMMLAAVALLLGILARHVLDNDEE
jgi:hypothetical protein